MEVFPDNLDNLMKACLAKIQDLVKSVPVIVFGLDAQDTKAVVIEGKYLNEAPRTVKEVEAIQFNSTKYKKGLINLDREHCIGIDIRFESVEAVVVIYSPEVPSPETVRQCLARGSRLLGAFNGFLYYEGPEYGREHTEHLCVNFDGGGLMGFATIVKVFREWLTKRRSKESIATVQSALSYGMVIKFVDFTNALPKQLGDQMRQIAYKEEARVSKSENDNERKQD